MKKLIAVCAVAAGMALFAGSANAQWHDSYQYRSYQQRPTFSGYYYSPSSYYRQPSYQWHDTSHWDYHPAQIQRHGNHYHVTPGHYDWHNQGHWH